MKKLVSLLLAVCMCLSVGIMLTACNEEHTHTLTKVEAVAATCETAGNSEYYTCDCGKYFSSADSTTEIAENSWVISATGHSFSNEWTYNDTHHWKVATCEHITEQSEYAEHSLTNNECTCGYVAITYTVEESRWNDLFIGDALNNVTVTTETKLYQTGVTEPIQTQNAVYKATENALYQVLYDASGENLADEEYLTQEDDKWYHLNKSDNVWVGNEIDSSNVSNYTFSGAIGVVFVDKKSAFTYDEETKCYVAEDFEAIDVILDIVKIYVKNGKFIKMEYTMTMGTNTMSATVILTDYGTTIINVPDWTATQVG